MTEWLNTYYPHIIAIAAGFVIRWGAMRFMATATAQSKGGSGGGGRSGNPGGMGGPTGANGGKKKWNKSRVIKFLTLLFVFAAGVLLAYGAYPLAQWLVSWGGTLGGIASVIFGTAALAAGWHSLHGLVTLIHDMTDGTPDNEAFTAGFWVPTTIPLGWGALVGLFSNPRGVSTGIACIAVSIVTAIYAHKILKKAHAAQGHYRLWMYFATVICGFVGVVHIPALAYLNQAIGTYLPEWLGWLIRMGLVIAAVIFFLVGLGDWIRDLIPEDWSQWAAMYSIPVFVVLTFSVATLGSNAETSLTKIFGAF